MVAAQRLHHPGKYMEVLLSNPTVLVRASLLGRVAFAGPSRRAGLPQAGASLRMDATKARAARNCIRSTCHGPRLMVQARCGRCLLSTRRGDADAPAVVANVTPMPSTSAECKEAFRTRFGAARRHVSRTRHARRPPAPNRRPRAVGIGRVVIAKNGADLCFAKKCAQTRLAAGRPG